jgi:cytoskeletal protein RodZ
MDKMLTAGEILRQNRLEKGYSLDEVSAATKIQKHYLKALEENNFDKFPSEVYTKGFIQNYAKFLNINAHKALALYRRSQGKDAPKSPKSIEQGPTKVKKKPKVVLTPTLILVVTVGVIVIATLGYLIFQFYNFQSPPELEVSQPPGNITIEEKDYVVKGQTEPDMFVTINDEAVRVTPDGKFEAMISLSEGTNTIIIKARHPDNIGKEAVITRNIEFEPDTDNSEEAANNAETDTQDSDSPSNANDDSDDDTSETDSNDENTEDPGGNQDEPLNLKISIVNADAWIEIAVDGEIAYSSVAPSGSELEYSAQEKITVVTGLISATQIRVNDQPQDFFIGEAGVASILCTVDDSQEVDCRRP